MSSKKERYVKFKSSGGGVSTKNDKRNRKLVNIRGCTAEQQFQKRGSTFLILFLQLNFVAGISQEYLRTSITSCVQEL